MGKVKWEKIYACKFHPGRKIDEIILQKLHRVAIAISNRIVSAGGKKRGKKRKKNETCVWFTQSLADSVFYHC